MAVNVNNDGTSPDPIPVATRALADGKHAQGLVLVASNATAETGLIPATVADGVLVNLGVNNDVTITGTVPVSGALTDAELRATAVPVSGPLTDAQLRATAVPVSGTVAVTGSATSANQSILIGHVDGVETALATANGLLGTIDADTGSLPGIATSVDGIEALIGTTNSTLTTIDGRVDGVEALLTTIDGRVDGLETLGSAANALLTTIDADTSILAATAKAGTSNDVTLASSTTSAQLVAANANRTGLTLFNTDANGVYVNIGGTASASVASVFIPGTDAVAAGTFAYWEMPRPASTEAVHAVWVGNGSGSLIGTELAA